MQLGMDRRICSAKLKVPPSRWIKEFKLPDVYLLIPAAVFASVLASFRRLVRGKFAVCLSLSLSEQRHFTGDKFLFQTGFAVMVFCNEAGCEVANWFGVGSR
jgi:hypothetical protein